VGEWVRAKACSANSCVEVRREHGGWILMHNTRADGEDLTVASLEEWEAFVQGVKDGDFDDL
jgi:Domain of unknown function (DUF397)